MSSRSIRTSSRSRAVFRNDLVATRDYRTPTTRKGKYRGPCDLCGVDVFQRFSDHSSHRVRHRDCENPS